MLSLAIKQRKIEKFYEKIKFKKNGCWEWKGRLATSLYGPQPTVCFGLKNLQARRFITSVLFGKTPRRIVQNCNTPKCVNPFHTYNYQQNANNNIKNKFEIKDVKDYTRTTPELVKKIHTMDKLGIPRIKIARKLKLCMPTVTGICKVANMCANKEI